ncbi:hypothetical protein E3N88_23027 [Mikania micrantha]|uniref:Uncharacterized protein n=1 Tax=Mikania micrantha TaxID=192012 RepID=A0A5N6NC45_9ASTR|nr:hypothetical protein E3N88_23027 [Mikania micrantha]
MWPPPSTIPLSRFPITGSASDGTSVPGGAIIHRWAPGFWIVMVPLKRVVNRRVETVAKGDDLVASIYNMSLRASSYYHSATPCHTSKMLLICLSDIELVKGKEHLIVAIPPYDVSHQ